MQVQHKDLKDTIQTAFILCLIVGIIVSIICISCAHLLLNLLNTKEELIDGAMLYFRIYALGMPAMAVYNFGNAVMSAGGDTKRPLLYLFIAGIVNVCLNLIFVIGFRLAEQGVAMASIISQYISATLIMTNLLRRNDVCKLRLSQVRINKNAAKAILMLGIPAGIQNAIFAIANLFIQKGVNSFDSVMVSGNSAAANFDALIYNVMSAFYTACSSFMGQNMGAGNKKRMLHSYFISIAYSFCAAGILGTVLFVFGRQLLSLFTSEPAVIDAGMARIKIMAFSYAVSAFMDASIAASRGIGNECWTYNYCYKRFVCIQGCMGIYNICIFSLYTFIVPCLCIFVDNYSYSRNSIFCIQFQTFECKRKILVKIRHRYL